jgi:bacteriocin biosynthesis cyclodehydratase domain-containing protein
MTDQQLTDQRPPTTGGDARPRLRGDVIWLRSDEGVYVRSAQSAMLLRGSSTYRLMSAISPYLTGEHSVVELCAGLPRAQSAAVANLVGALLERGMAHDLRQSAQRELPAPLADRFADQLAFLGHFADDPVDRFLAYRTARVVVIGAGHALHAVATGLLGNGLGTLRLAGAAVTDPHRPAIESTAATLAATVEIASADVDLSDVDLLAYCADETDLALVARLAGRCRAAGVRFLPAVLRGRRALLGPLVGPDRAGCWTCAQLRLAANDPPEVAADTWRSIALGPVTPDPSAPTETVSRMIGNAAAFDVFRELTGALPPDTQGAVLVQDTLTLESGVARLIAHPRCPACAGTGLRAAPAAPDETDESRYERLTALVDHRTGPFAEFTDDALRQSPLPTGRLRVAPPAGPDGAVREFVGFDVQTVLRARLSAARTAVGHYADRLAAVPVRVGVPADLDAPAIGADRLGTWAGLRAAGPDEPTGWLPAVSLLTGERQYVPAGAVFPATRWNSDRVFEAGPAGLGVGADAEAAADAGLLTALAYRALDRMLRGVAAVTALDPDALPDGAEHLTFLRDCLRHLGHSPTLRLIEDGPVPVVLAGFGPPAGSTQPAGSTPAGSTPAGSVWRVGVAGDRAGAVREALTLLLGGAQLDAYHGGAADLGDPLVADLPPVIAATAPPSGEAAPADRPAILRHLADLGHDALFAVTTPADLASVGGFHTGRVLLARPADDRPGPPKEELTG